MGPKAAVVPESSASTRFPLALFQDATEIVWRVADYLSAHGLGPLPPERYFVRDAEEVHRLALEGTVPVVGMSLDDVLDCARSGHRNASQITAFYGVHRGFLSLLAQPEVADVAALKGRTVGVDTLSGYASALFEMLARQAIDYKTDLTVTLAGATNLRYDKLMRREFEGTLLGAPYDLLAAAQGCRSLAHVLQELGGYQGVVFAAHRGWLDSHMAEAQNLVGTFSNALAWAQAPAHRRAVAQVVQEGLPAAPSLEVLGAIVERLFGGDSDFNPGGSIARRDAEVVRDLFSTYREVDLSDLDLSSVIDTRLTAKNT